MKVYNVSMKWCLPKETVERFKKGLSSREIDPVKLAEMTSEERASYLEKYVGREFSHEVNALFESKLLLKNKKAGYITWAKKVAGISKEAKRDMISRIERLEGVLSPQEEQAFLKDLAESRLGFGVSETEAKVIADLSKQARDLKARANSDGTFLNKEDRFAYGAHQVALEKYVNELKLKSKEISLREMPLKKVKQMIGDIPGATKSLMASLDNSFWGRQGIQTLTDPKTASIWIKAFLKSWTDIGKELRGIDAIDLIRADIYSRPNALNGKYNIGGYGLDVLSEEAFPSALPEKIPLLGRLYKASESAYNGGALRLRADLADRFIALAEKNGLNMLDRNEARPLGDAISSFTGRGKLPFGFDKSAKPLNELFFSVKFLQSRFDFLVAPLKYYLVKKPSEILGGNAFESKGQKFAQKQSAEHTLRVIATIGLFLAIAKMLDPDAVDEDPRSTNFGKVKVFGKYRDVTGGIAPIISLASRTIPSYHDGEYGQWMKSSSGKWTNLRSGKYGQTDAFDNIMQGLIENKLSPIAGLFRDAVKGQFFGGEPFTLSGALKNMVTPLALQSSYEAFKDPTTEFALADLILEGLGLSANSFIMPNEKTKLLETEKPMNPNDMYAQVYLYSKAFGTDPETAWNKMFAGQRIEKVQGGKIVIVRSDVAKSQAYKSKYGKDNKNYKLDHTIPLALAGNEREDNYRLVTTSMWSLYTPLEVTLITAVEKNEISIKKAQKVISDYKSKVTGKNGDIKEDLTFAEAKKIRDKIRKDIKSLK